MEGTRARTRFSASKGTEEASAGEAPKRKANFPENSSPIAKRTRNKKGNNSSSESATDDEKLKDDLYTRLKEENKKLRMELEATKEEHHKTKEENTRSKQLETDLSNAHSKIETIMNDAHSKIVNLEKELFAAQEELDNMAPLRTENSHRHAIQQELNNACTEIDKLKSENVGLCEDLEKLRKESNVTERNGLMKALTHACSELDKARIEIANLKNTQTTTAGESSQAVKTLKEEIKKLEFENAQRNGLHMALTHACAELDRCREECAKLTTQIAALRKGDSKGEEDPLDLSSKSRLHKESTDKPADFHDEIRKLKAEIIQLRAAPPMVVTVAASASDGKSSEYAHAEINMLHNEVLEMRGYKEDAMKMKAEMKQLQTDNKKMSRLQEALSHACGEVDKLRDEITQEKALSSALHVQIARQSEIEKYLVDSNGDVEKLRFDSAIKASLEEQLNVSLAEIDLLRQANADKNRLESELIAARTDVNNLKLDLIKVQAENIKHSK